MRSLPVVTVEPERRSGDDGGLVEVLVIDRGGAVAGGTGAAGGAPGEVGVRGSGVAAAVRGGLRDARGGVSSGGLWFSRHREGARRAPLLCLCDGEYP